MDMQLEKLSYVKQPCFTYIYFKSSFIGSPSCIDIVRQIKRGFWLVRAGINNDKQHLLHHFLKHIGFDNVAKCTLIHPIDQAFDGFYFISDKQLLVEQPIQLNETVMNIIVKLLQTMLNYKVKHVTSTQMHTYPVML